MKRIFTFVFILQFPVLVFAQEIWTLEDSVKYVMERSYSVSSAGAEVSARQGDLSQAGAWPNPSVELNVNEKLGLQDNSGGNDLTEISINQPIPLGRLSRQKKESKAKLQAAQQNFSYQQLLLETETARRFHSIQLKAAKLDLAQEQLKFSKEYQKNDPNHSKEKVVRYLTPLEQKRLNIIFATSDQEVLSAEGEYSEELYGLRTLLQLSPDAPYKTAELNPVQLTETLEDLISKQKERHPAIKAFRYQQEAADAGISLAWGELFPDPSVKVFRETDTFDDGRQAFYGVAINFQIPIWDFKRGSISKAKHEAEKVKYDLKTIEQEFQVRLHQGYLHLARLVKQAEQYKTNVLIPSQEVLELTKSGFDVGEVDLLNFIDANKTYFEARKNYLELLYEASIEFAEVRLAAGISLLDHRDFNSSIGGK
jgi:cobalt-zinc-cadmium efflux system outer membrane protein